MTQGMEATFRAAVVHDNLGSFAVDVGYQYLDARDQSIMDAIERGLAGTLDDPLTADEYGGLWLRSRHSGTLRVQYDSEDKQWSANIRLQVVGRYGDESLDKNGFVVSEPQRRALDRDDEYVDGYTVVNLALTRAFDVEGLGSVTIGAGINNALDIARPTLIPGLVGRQAFVQTSVRF
jgi:outer membrane receptor for ferrienterochelin and colicins